MVVPSEHPTVAGALGDGVRELAGGVRDGVLLLRHGAHGGALQVDPMKPTLKPPGTKRVES
jgi:hypothetical protein